jgi:hypothetical protein
MDSAYVDAAGRPNPVAVELGGGIIGGMTLSPGVYKWSSAVTIPTDITLAGTGSGSDVWIFQITGALTQAANTTVNLTGGAKAEDITWVMVGAATIGATAHFEGTVLASAITTGAGASVCGRLFARSSVTLDSSEVTEPGSTVACQ